MNHDQNDLPARLAHLQAKKQSYKTLQSTLTTLPQRLRHDALVALGPRLYARGQLHRTNEVLVLLGSDGDSAYFAERSAHQAHQIVARRIQAVEEAEQQASRTYQERMMDNLCERIKQRQLAQAREIEKREQDEHSMNAPTIKRRPSILKSPSQNKSNDEHNGLKRKNSHSRRVHFADDTKNDDDDDDQVQPQPQHQPQLQFQSQIQSHSKSQSKNKKKNKKKNKNKSKNKEMKNSASELQNELQNAIMAAQTQANNDGIVQFTEFYANEDDREPTSVDMQDTFQPDQNVDFDDDFAEQFLDITGSKKATAVATERNTKQQLVRHDGGDDKTETQHQQQAEVKEKEQEQEQEQEKGEEKNVDDEEWTTEDEREMMLRDLLEAEKMFEEQEEQEEQAEDQNAKEEQQKEIAKQAKEEKKFGSGFNRGFFTSSIISSPSSSASSSASSNSKKKESGNMANAKNNREEEEEREQTDTTSSNSSEATSVREVVQERKSRTGRRKRKASNRKRNVQREVVDILDPEQLEENDQEEEEMDFDDDMSIRALMKDQLRLGGGEDQGTFENDSMMEQKRVSKFKQMREKRRQDF